MGNAAQQIGSVSHLYKLGIAPIMTECLLQVLHTFWKVHSHIEPCCNRAPKSLRLLHVLIQAVCVCAGPDDIPAGGSTEACGQALFAKDIVEYHGQIVGLIVAKSQVGATFLPCPVANCPALTQIALP